MSCLSPYLANAHRLVGDPIDVVTGAILSADRDLHLSGPLPLRWIRHYDSSQSGRMCAIGWGQTHRYDWQLQMDVDGIRLVGPVGYVVGFPPLSADGQEVVHQGFVLERRTARRYHVYQSDQPTMEFEFADFAKSAPLQRITFGSCSISFEYDQAGRLTRIVDSLHRQIHVKNDTEGRILELTLVGESKDQERVLLSYRYDRFGRLIQGMDAYHNTFSFQYDPDNRMVKRTDRRGYSFQFEYDQSGRCIRSTGEDGLHETRLRYLPEGAGTIVTKADGGEWLYVYDAGAITKIVNPYGGVQTFTMDANGRLDEQIDPNGNGLQMVYDDTGVLLGIRDGFGRFRREGEDAFSDPYNRQYMPGTPFAWELGSDWAFSSFRLAEADSPLLVRLPTSVARLVEMAPPRATHSSASPGWRPAHKPVGPGEDEYDLFGNLLRHTDPAGASQRWLYDANGNISRHTDAEGSVWTSDYTSWNLLTRQADPLGNVTQYEYTRSEKISSLINPGGTISDFTYDLKDRLVTRKRHRVVKETLRYDPADNLIEQRDARGQTLYTVQVGPGNLPTSVHVPDGETRSFKYDARRRLIEALNDAGHVQRKFDDLGNLVSDERDALGVRHRFRGFKLQETIALDRFRTTVEEQKDGTRVVTDPAGRKHRLRCLGNGVFLRSLADGTEEISQYDWAGRCRLKAAYFSDGYELLWSRQYRYSPVGNLVQMKDSESGSVHYHYDAAHRLSREVRLDSMEQPYEYDAGGNLLKAPGLGDVATHENRLRAANGSQFVYNHRNHIAERADPAGATYYEYNAVDQLIRCRTPQGEWTARYDALGRRVSKTWQGKTTVYHWDRERLIAEVLPDGRVRVYVYLHVQARVPFLFIEYDNLDADPQTGRRYYIFTNQIGCPVLITDDLHQVIWRATVEAYGRASVHPNSRIEFHLRFPGHYFDEETGLHYNRHRYYSPELGRYLQSDPIDIDGGINIYAYTKCPLVEVDMDGCACPLGPLTEKQAKELEDKIKEAQALAAKLRDAMKEEETGRFRPQPEIDPETGKQLVVDGKPVWDGPDFDKPITAHDNVTLAVNVIRGEDGELKTVVTSSSGPAGVPDDVKAIVKQDTGSDIQSPNPRPRGSVPKEGDTGNHAEQKGDRLAKQEGGQLESTTPTRPCCPGCTKALQNRNGDNSDPNLDVVNPMDGTKKTTKG